MLPPSFGVPGDDVTYYECIAARCGGWLVEDIASIFDDHESDPPQNPENPMGSRGKAARASSPAVVPQAAGGLFESIQKALVTWDSQTGKVQLAGGFYLKANGVWINLRHPGAILAECVAMQKGKAGEWEMLTTPQAVRDYMVKVRDGEQPVKHPALKSLNPETGVNNAKVSSSSFEVVS